MGILQKQKFNKASQSDLRKLSSFLQKDAKKQPIHCGSCWRRYERGPKINRTSHVLNLRHVVAGLSALKSRFFVSHQFLSWCQIVVF